MTTARLGGALAAARQLVPPLPDGELLRRYAADRDEAAFRHLVLRHGPLVLGVCRRIVPDIHLADDAFQAVFAVLAAKANSLDGSRPLGPWLYGVASKVSMRARAMIGRRRKRETFMPTVPEVPVFAPEPTDAAAILDEEIAGLSEACRTALILCELQGYSRKEASAKLGIAEGTLSSRLAAARKALAERLRKRGVTGPALLAGVALPPALANAAVQAAGGSASAVVLELTQGVVRTMLLSKLKLVPVLLAGVLLAVCGLDGSRRESVSAAPVPKMRDEGLIWIREKAANRLVAYNSNLEVAKAVKLPKGVPFLGLTPDGGKILYAAKAANADGPTYHLRDLGEDTPGTDLGLDYSEWDHHPFWTRDGKKFLRARSDVGRKMVGVRSTIFRYDLFDLASKQATHLDGIPFDHWIMGWAADGERFVSYHLGEKNDTIHLMEASGKSEVFSASHDRLHPHRISVSQDGYSILMGGFAATPPDEPWHQAIWTLYPKTGKAVELSHEEGQGMSEPCWSPDGKRIAYAWCYQKDAAKSDGWDAARLTVADDDGTGRKTITLRDKAKGEDPYDVQFLGWYPTVKIKAPVPKEEKDAGLIWLHNTKTGKLTAYSPDGKKQKELALKDGDCFLGFTPDGTKIAFAGRGGKLAEEGDTKELTLHLRDVNDKTEGIDTELRIETELDRLIWLPDGKRVIAVRPMTTKMYCLHDLFDTVTKREKKLDIDLKVYAADVAPNGEWLLTIGRRASNRGMLKVPFPDGEPTALAGAGVDVWSARISPDGRTIACVGYVEATPKGTPPPAVVRTLDVRSGAMNEIARHENGNWSAGVFWSPEGMRIAYLRPSEGSGKPRHIVVCDIDGKNAKPILPVEDEYEHLKFVGWFPSKSKAAAPDPRKRNAPLPKVASPKPQKLPRLPEPDPELRAALFKFDTEYRHGSAEKFEELEKLAEELAKMYPAKDDRARIWYEVAFVAAQSDIRKQANRVRKYAAKCLEISRDPRLRGDCHSLLASAVDVEGAAFEKGRREAAGHLLEGYAELLAQELPDQAPELPGVGKIGGAVGQGGPEEVLLRARHAAQMAAHDEAKYIGEVVARRDTLALQLRDLYEPNPKRHGRNSEGAAELRTLAEKKLPEKADVDALLRRVLPKG